MGEDRDFSTPCCNKGSVPNEIGRDLRLDLFAPLMFELLNLWEGFKESVKFIDGNGIGLDGLMKYTYI